MELILEGIYKAVALLVTLDPEVLNITFLSLKVSGTATLISLLIGLPLGTLLALNKFPGRAFFLTIVGNLSRSMPCPALRYNVDYNAHYNIPRA